MKTSKRTAITKSVLAAILAVGLASGFVGISGRAALASPTVTTAACPTVKEAGKAKRAECLAAKKEAALLKRASAARKAVDRAKEAVAVDRAKASEEASVATEETAIANDEAEIASELSPANPNENANLASDVKVRRAAIKSLRAAYSAFVKGEEAALKEKLASD